ncbi:hypothetical protein U9M48_044169 [Paspalum notatum var. saurae]|uniref:Uncharacterized protein n=1 Tax=Paspalum notatum var. saurae TaxID=547442 RepID=A0AAQ3V0T6_PASNO
MLDSGYHIHHRTPSVRSLERGTCQNKGVCGGREGEGTRWRCSDFGAMIGSDFGTEDALR